MKTLVIGLLLLRWGSGLQAQDERFFRRILGVAPINQAARFEHQETLYIALNF